MEATVFYLLILEKYINSKQKTPRLGNISKDFTMNNVKKSELKVSEKFFWLILILLILMIF